MREDSLLRVRFARFCIWLRISPVSQKKNEPLGYYDWFDNSVFQDYFEQTTFIPLDMEGSPFTQEIEGMVPNEEGAVLTDYFQKILILPNSEEAPKIK